MTLEQFDRDLKFLTLLEDCVDKLDVAIEETKEAICKKYGIGYISGELHGPWGEMYGWSYNGGEPLFNSMREAVEAKLKE